MTFDHGVLNIKGRNRNFEAELDRHLEAQALQKRKEAKAAAALFKANKAQAKALLAEHGAAIVAQMSPGISKRQNITPTKAAREITRVLDQMVKWEPGRFLALVDRFKTESEVGKPGQSEEKDGDVKILSASASELGA